jgi:uncharacterized protein YfiM (DUF2279 family)
MSGVRPLALAVILASSIAVPVARAEAPAAPPDYPPPSVRAWQTGMLRADRLQHASLALTLALSTGVASRSNAAAFATGFTLGLMKELWDMRRSHFDWVDLIADTGGAAAGAALTHAVTR